MYTFFIRQKKRNVNQTYVWFSCFILCVLLFASKVQINCNFDSSFNNVGFFHFKGSMICRSLMTRSEAVVDAFPITMLDVAGHSQKQPSSTLHDYMVLFQLLLNCLVLPYLFIDLILFRHVLDEDRCDFVSLS